MEKMFCYQCEQTAGGTGCTRMGVCGKTPECAAMHDLLIQLVKEASLRPGSDPRLLADGLFATVTNVDFDPAEIAALARQVAAAAGRDLPSEDAALFEAARRYSILARQESRGAETVAAEELLMYGLKGMAAYLHHADRLGRRDEGCDAFLKEALALILRGDATREALTGCILECGKQNLRAMEILNEAHIAKYGAPSPSPVRITPVPGKAILISGHDLKDLEAVLEATQGTGIQVYTHSEMLPAHGYPGLRKYPHLAGNYGGAWQDQAREFDAFPGAILMTTNCIQKPRDSYRDRIFTTGLVRYPGVTHLPNGDWEPLIAAAQRAPGFPAEATEPEKTILVGFGHDAVAAAAATVLDLIGQGKIRHFFLVGGCDGARPGRNYYTELAEQIPADCVILTLACGKYRFNKLEFGAIEGLPRLLDVGQCNDAYSAVRIALLLADALQCGVNDLPLSIILSWYEQKAVAVLLTLLSLGIRNIKIGPSLPAFVSPAMLQLLVEEFAVAPVTDATKDLKTILGKK